MVTITDHEFEALVDAAIDAIPERFARHLSNLAFVIEDEPTAEQLHANDVAAGGSLLGLYEGIPLPDRGDGYNYVLPDKISIFRGPLCAYARDRDELAAEVHETVWHEVAHYFGLDHLAIDGLHGHAD